MNPTVSVIVPYHNQEAFLAEAIESVQAQSLLDWELLLVDDGSQDAGPSIAERYARQDRRIRLLCHPAHKNMGAAASRNLGIQEAKGMFLAFLDGDDVYLPEKLEIETAALNRAPAAAALYSRTIWRFPDGKSDLYEDLGVATDRIYQPPELVSRIILGSEGAIPCTCAVMVRRECALAAGGFEEAFALFEDQTFWVKLFTKYVIYISSHCEAIYRQHSGSTSARAVQAGLYHDTSPNISERIFLEWVERFMQNENIKDEHVARALYEKLAIYRRPIRVRARALLRRVVRRMSRLQVDATLRG